MSKIQLVKSSSRVAAVKMLIEHQGIPDGFRGAPEYTHYIDTIMDKADYAEYYLMVDDFPVAFVAMDVCQDVHHAGFIFDCAQVVVSKYARRDEVSALWRALHAEAIRLGCSWKSRCKHNDDGSITTHYRRIYGQED